MRKESTSVNHQLFRAASEGQYTPSQIYLERYSAVVFHYLIL